jgi:RND superfamily putative drug exporter
VGLSAESLARASCASPWRVIGAWVAAVAAAGIAAAALLPGTLTTEDEVLTDTEAKRGQALIDERFPEERVERELAIVHSQSLTVEDEAFARATGRLSRRLRAEEAVVSPDGHAALLRFPLGDLAEAERLVQSVGAAPQIDAELYGGEIVERDFNEASKQDLLKGETFGAATALFVLVLVFGAVVGAVVPLLLGLVAIVVSLGLATLVGQAVDLSIFVTNVIGGMGLALGIDYSLFVVSRFREERARGLERAAAIAAAGATASRAVLFSGFAVAVALLGILFVPDTVLRSLGIGATIVAAVSVLAALTLLPALLALLGDRVNAGRVPLARRAAASGDAEGRFWGGVARRVMRRPLPSLVAVLAVLLALAAPVVDLETSRLGVETLPEERPARQGYDLLLETFGYGAAFPTRIVVPDGDPSGVVAAVRSDRRFGTPRVRRSDGVALVEAPLAGDPLGEEAFAAVRDLRERLPEDVLVAGVTAANLDYVDETNAARPAVFAFVFGMSFLLLLVAFRSVVVPVKAILLNLLSVGAAYGALVLVFVKGVGNALFGLDQVEAVEVWVPVFLFSILFGLSMDYHVFLLSRIRERFVLTGDNERAVAFGIASTGRIITGAALIIIVVFCGFALGDLVMFQQMGFGVAVALLLDATLIRSVLVPAAMKLLGRWNWYLPPALEFLPHWQVDPPRG